jgi:hypothetical protein
VEEASNTNLRLDTISLGVTLSDEEAERAALRLVDTETKVRATVDILFVHYYVRRVSSAGEWMYADGCIVLVFHPLYMLKSYGA